MTRGALGAQKSVLLQANTCIRTLVRCRRSGRIVSRGRGRHGHGTAPHQAVGRRLCRTPPQRKDAPRRGAVSLGAHRVAAALADAGRARDRDEWLAVVGDCQSLINTLTAVQDTAIAEAARRESVWCEDGTLGETVHAPRPGGPRCRRRARAAARGVAPAGAAPRRAGRPPGRATGCRCRPSPRPARGQRPGWAARGDGAGQLDGYRAGVIAFELEVAPADVADAIVAALVRAPRRRRLDAAAAHPGAALAHLPRPGPRARQAGPGRTGLRRWVAEPGVDEWHGTFPSEDAASAWAAIDRLAHDLVAAGTCTNIEQARGKALTDLVTGNATIDVQIVLTVPADSQPAPDAPEVTEAAPDRVGSASTALVSNTPAPGPSAVAGSEPTAALTNEPVPVAGTRGVTPPVASAAIAQHLGAGPDGLPAPARASGEMANIVTVPVGRQATPALSGNDWADTVTVHSAQQPRPEPFDDAADVQETRRSTQSPPDAEPKAVPPRHPVTEVRSDDDAAEVQDTPRPTQTAPHAELEAVPELTPSPRPDPTTTWSRCRGAGRPSRCSCAAAGCGPPAQAAPDKPGAGEGGTAAVRPLRPAHRGTPRPR